MSAELLNLVLYAAPLALIWLAYAHKRQKQDRRSIDTLTESRESGLTHPASLHPVIDVNKCIGCESCVAACPEMPTHQVLGMIRRKAALVSPTDCIGHGVCRTVCPVDAITLVFGTAERGVDIPDVSPEFETSVPGIFIAGELGGMGLIRNAIEQGRQAMNAIARRVGRGSGDALDVLIIGAGPSGFSASLAAKQHELRYLTIEQGSLGGTVANFPRRKLVMTAPAELPVVGKVNFRETTKETLIEFWTKVHERIELNIRFGERLETVTRRGELFHVRTTKAEYLARSLLLSLGRRGTPRRLGVPGEELPKVTYHLIDPEQYRDQHVLVVGGGDSALESAISISEQAGTTVTLSYRSAAFTRAKRKNREKLSAAEQSGRINVLLESNVKSIHPAHVLIDSNHRTLKLRNDAVIVNAGGVLPTALLREMGISVTTKYGTA